MMDRLQPVINWSTRHPVTSLFIAIDIAISFCIRLMIKYNLKQNYTWFYIVLEVLFLFGSYDMGKTIFGVICLLLYSGIEKSIGSLKYLLWIFITTAMIFAWRLFVIRENANGFVFPIFCPIFTFLLYHKPYYYLSIKSLEFDDRLFYTLFFIESIFICGWQNIIPCLIGNIIMLAIEKIFSCACNGTHTRRTDIGAEEDLPELRREESM